MPVEPDLYRDSSSSSSLNAGDMPRHETKAERRSRENDEALGGLRSPWKAIEAVPSLRKAGALIREVLETWIDAQPEDFVDRMLTSDFFAAEAEKYGDEVAEVMANRLGVNPARS